VSGRHLAPLFRVSRVSFKEMVFESVLAKSIYSDCVIKFKSISSIPRLREKAETIRRRVQ